MTEFNFSFSCKLTEITDTYVVIQVPMGSRVVTVRVEDPERKAAADKAKEEAAAEEARKEAEKKAAREAAAERARIKEENFERLIAGLEEYTGTKRDTWISDASTPVWQDNLYAIYVRKVMAGMPHGRLKNHINGVADGAFRFFKVLESHVH